MVGEDETGVDEMHEMVVVDVGAVNVKTMHFQDVDVHVVTNVDVHEGENSEDVGVNVNGGRDILPLVLERALIEVHVYVHVVVEHYDCDYVDVPHVSNVNALHVFQHVLLHDHVREEVLCEHHDHECRVYVYVLRVHVKMVVVPLHEKEVLHENYESEEELYELHDLDADVGVDAADLLQDLQRRHQ